MNTPDNWIILKIKEENGDRFYYKVLAGWSGGYLTSDAWRMNSGIARVEESEKYYDFIGESGSVYRCGKHSQMVRMNIGHVLEQLLEQYPDTVEHVDVKEMLENVKCTNIEQQ